MAILKKGDRLGSYLVGDLLGTGGMGEVYQGRHVELDRDVAIKVLNPTFNADPTFPLRFRREAKVTARLSHPNIITVHDFGDTGVTAYLVMELASGSMSDELHQLSTLREMVDALGPVFAAVAYANERGVVHRDIKPDNLLMKQAQHPLLADFGLARLQSESFGADVGLILGTPYYMSPEQIDGADVDGRADVYALGVLVYALVVGRLPFDGTTFTAVASQHLKKPAPAVKASLPEAPEVLDAAVRRAMAKRPADRYATASEFYADLCRAAEELPTMSIGAAVLAEATTQSAAAMLGGIDLGGTMIGRSADADAGAEVAADGAGVPGAAIALGDASLEQCPTCESWIPLRMLLCPACGGKMPAVRGQRAAVAAPTPTSGQERTVRPRASSFTAGQKVALRSAAVVVLAVNAVGLWLKHAGREAGGEHVASGITTYIFDNLGWIKSVMALAGLVLAALASYDMWLVVIDPRARRPATYARLRQYHRLMGYAAAVTAYSIGLLTCVGIFGFDFSTTRRAAHTVIGTALLVALAAKVLIVRRGSRYRRHLDVVGLVLVAYYVLALLTSAAPWVWHQLTTGSSGLSDYY